MTVKYAVKTGITINKITNTHARERFEQLDDTGTMMVSAERFPLGITALRCPTHRATVKMTQT